MHRSGVDENKRIGAHHVIKTGFDQMVERLEYMQGRMESLETENVKLQEMLDADRREILPTGLPTGG